MPVGTSTPRGRYLPAVGQSVAAGDPEWGTPVNNNFLLDEAHDDSDGLVDETLGHIDRAMPLPWVVVHPKLGVSGNPGHLDRPTNSTANGLLLMDTDAQGRVSGTMVWKGGKIFDGSGPYSGWDTAAEDICYEIIDESFQINAYGFRGYVMGGGLGQGGTSSTGVAELKASYVFVTSAAFPDDGTNVFGFGGTDIACEGLVVKMEGKTQAVGFEYKDPGGFGGKNFRLESCIANGGGTGFRLGTYSNDNTWLVTCTASNCAHQGFQLKKGSTASNNVHFVGCTSYYCGDVNGGVAPGGSQMNFQGSVSGVEPNAISIVSCRFFGVAPAILSEGGHSITISGQCQFELASVGVDGRTVADAAMASTTAVITSATAAFITSDVGKVVVIEKSDNSWVGHGTITTRNSATSITVSFTNTSGGDLTGATLLISPVIDRPVLVATQHPDSTALDYYGTSFILEDGYMHQIPNMSAWTAGYPAWLKVDHHSRVIVRSGVQFFGETARLTAANPGVLLQGTALQCSIDLATVYDGAGRSIRITDPVKLYIDQGVGNEVFWTDNMGVVQSSRRGTVSKTSAENLTQSSTTLANDGELMFHGDANVNYRVRLILSVTGLSVTPDLKVGIGLPSGVAQYNATKDTGGVAPASGSAHAAATQAGSASVGTDNNTQIVEYTFLVNVGSTGGVVHITRAQGTSTAENVTLNIGSVLEYQRITP